MNYVYWYCPNCGIIYDCFEKEERENCEKCWSKLKETDISCIDGIVYDSRRAYADRRLILDRYLRKELDEHNIKTIESLNSSESENIMAKSAITQFEVNYFAPKIETLKRMIANGEEITIDINAERRKCRELYKQRKEIEQITNPSFTDTRPKCPTCGSTNIKKISDLERGVSIGMWGLFSSKIGKTMKCNSCGHKW